MEGCDGGNKDEDDERTEDGIPSDGGFWEDKELLVEGTNGVMGVEETPAGGEVLGLVGEGINVPKP